jgi:hypothetical protein
VDEIIRGLIWRVPSVYGYRNEEDTTFLIRPVGVPAGIRKAEVLQLATV